MAQGCGRRPSSAVSSSARCCCSPGRLPSAVSPVRWACWGWPPPSSRRGCGRPAIVRGPSIPGRCRSSWPEGARAGRCTGVVRSRLLPERWPEGSKVRPLYGCRPRRLPERRFRGRRVRRPAARRSRAAAGPVRAGPAAAPRSGRRARPSLGPCHGCSRCPPASRPPPRPSSAARCGPRRPSHPWTRSARARPARSPASPTVRHRPLTASYSAEHARPRAGALHEQGATGLDGCVEQLRRRRARAVRAAGRRTLSPGWPFPSPRSPGGPASPVVRPRPPGPAHVRSNLRRRADVGEAAVPADEPANPDRASVEASRRVRGAGSVWTTAVQSR